MYVESDEYLTFEGLKMSAEFTCKICSSSFVTKSGFSQHVQSQHKGDKFQCGDCGKQFVFKNSLTRQQCS